LRQSQRDYLASNVPNQKKIFAKKDFFWLKNLLTVPSFLFKITQYGIKVAITLGLLTTAVGELVKIDDNLVLLLVSGVSSTRHFVNR
jgi:hypothetical protein